MTHSEAAVRSVSKPKPYPRWCGECGRETLQPADIPYDAKVNHDETLHQFHVSRLPVDRCENCGEIYFTNRTDEHLCNALRDHLDLLQPAELREALGKIQLSEAEFAERLGVPFEKVANWMQGILIPSRAMDNLMRVFLAFPNVREALSAPAPTGLHDVCTTARPEQTATSP